MAETAFGAKIIGTVSGIVAKIKSISGGGQSLSAIETSNMNMDTATNLIGIIRGKPFTFEVEYETDTIGDTYDAYSAEVTYSMGDKVGSGGTNYFCIVSGINKTPATNATYWSVYTGGNHEVVQAASELRTADTWTVTFADTSTIIGTGTITDYSSPEGETESGLTFTFEITPETVWDRTGVV